MPILCEDLEYMLFSLNSVGDLDKVLILKAQIDDIDRENLWADVTYLTTPDPADDIMPETRIRFHYHCEFSNGTEEDLEHGHKAFANGDIVYVLQFLNGFVGDARNTTLIIGHADIEDTKMCNSDLLYIELSRKGSTTYYPSINAKYIIIVDMDTGQLIPEYLFPAVGDNDFNSWFSDNIELITHNQEIGTDNTGRIESDWSADNSVDERTAIGATRSDSCVDEGSNNIYCFGVATPDGGTPDYTITPYGLYYTERHQTCTGYFYPELVSETDDGRVVWGGSVHTPGDVGLSEGTWYNTTCDAHEPVFPFWTNKVLITRKKDGVSMYYELHTYCELGEYEHVFKTPLNYEFFAVHKNRYKWTEDWDIDKNIETEIIWSGDGCVAGSRPMIMDYFNSITSTKRYTYDYQIWLPWKPNEVTPFYHVTYSTAYLGNHVEINDETTSGDCDKYRDDTGIFTAVVRGDACSIVSNYLTINDSAIVVGFGGTYALTCCFSFKDVLYEEYEAGTGEAWPWDENDMPGSRIENSCSYTYDNYELGIECAISNNTITVDPFSNITLINLNDFHRTAIALALEDRLAELVTYFRETEYPSGDITREECWARSGTWWGLSAKICRRNIN